MRVIELWTNTPMRFGVGGNIMTSHLVEIPRRATDGGEAERQVWHQSPGKLPEQCLSLTMAASEVGVGVVIEQPDGSYDRYVVRDVASARLETWEAAVSAPPAKIDAPWGDFGTLPSRDEAKPAEQPKEAAKGKRR